MILKNENIKTGQELLLTTQTFGKIVLEPCGVVVSEVYYEDKSAVVDCDLRGNPNKVYLEDFGVGDYRSLNNNSLWEKTPKNEKKIKEFLEGDEGIIKYIEFLKEHSRGTGEVIVGDDSIPWSPNNGLNTLF